jgi:hypothetical protein
VYSSRSAEIMFRFLPLPAGHQVAEDERIMVGGAATGGWIGSANRLRDRLDEKAGKYRLDGQPFAIVVGARDSWCTIDEVHQGLPEPRPSWWPPVRVCAEVTASSA